MKGAGLVIIALLLMGSGGTVPSAPAPSQPEAPSAPAPSPSPSVPDKESREAPTGDGCDKDVCG